MRISSLVEPQAEICMLRLNLRRARALPNILLFEVLSFCATRYCQKPSENDYAPQSVHGFLQRLFSMGTNPGCETRPTFFCLHSPEYGNATRPCKKGKRESHPTRNTGAWVTLTLPHSLRPGHPPG